MLPEITGDRPVGPTFRLPPHPGRGRIAGDRGTGRVAVDRSRHDQEITMSAKAVAPRRTAARSLRPRFEALEDRRLPSTIVALTEQGQLLRVDSDRASQVLATTTITGL